MDRTDWLLTALASAGDSGLTPVQIQKSLFIFGRETGMESCGNYYRFQPYDYGPFDAAIYSDADALCARGLVEIDRSGSVRKYKLTDAGRRHAGAGLLSSEGSVYMQSVVGWVKRHGFGGLLRAVYERYPDMVVNSVFRG